MASLRDYYLLTKPGIIRGNIMTAAAGYLLAAAGNIEFATLVSLLVGTSLVIAAACVLNNYVDRHIDARMQRTKQRALVSGRITTPAALGFAGVLAVAGFGTLIVGTNIQTLAVGLAGFVAYVVLYGIGKRRTIYGTEVGSISGATPILAGYVAAAGTFDAGGWLLFALMVLWQMPHFHAIAIFRKDDYAAAGLPVLPVARSIQRTRLHIGAYITAYALTVPLLTTFDYTGYTFLVLMLLASGWWLYVATTGWKLPPRDASAAAKWAKKLFVLSLYVLLLFSILLAFESVLP